MVRDRQSKMPASDPPDMRGVTMAIRWWSGGRVNVARFLQVSVTLRVGPDDLPKNIGVPT